VVDHYDQHFGLGLSESERNDLVEYLKSLPEPDADRVGRHTRSSER